MVWFYVPAFMDNHRRRAPAVTPDNYTGNFVWTTAFSMDANRSATSLLPQSALLCQLYVEPFGANCTKRRVPTVCSVAILTIYALIVGKVTRFDHFCRSLENNSSARCSEMTSDPKKLDIQTHGRWSGQSVSPSHQNQADFCFFWFFVFLIGLVYLFVRKCDGPVFHPACSPLVAGHSLNPPEFPPCCVASLVTTSLKLLSRRCGFITSPHRSLASCKMYILLGLTLRRTTRHSSSNNNNNNLRLRSYPHFA